MDIERNVDSSCQYIIYRGANLSRYCVKPSVVRIDDGLNLCADHALDVARRITEVVNAVIQETKPPET